MPLVKENPYRLARDIRGIGFKTADELAQKLGIPKTSMLRARAGISYALLQAVENGDCGLPEEDLLTLAEQLLEIGRDTLAEALRLEVAEESVVLESIDGRPCVFLPHLRRAEEAIAAATRRLQVGRPPWPQIDAEKAIEWVERRLGVTLAAGQKDAVRCALASKLLVLTGGPGVGNTTIIRAILTIVKAKGVQPLLAAPTGRAAKRLSESTGNEACLLEVNPKEGGFVRGADFPLECDLLVLDEVSMVDVPMMANVLQALPQHAALLIVGDVDQLPSVGPGQVLADLIGCGRRGAAGARALNLALQSALNASRPGAPAVERFGFTYRVGDKVMQVENNYDRDVFNGDLGFISGLDEEEAEMTVDFDGRAVRYPYTELDELTLAYATTIHKSQGSEYPAVVIPVVTQHYTMLQRNLLYTGLTRGKQLVVLIGQKKAVGIAVRGVQGRRRWSKLKELLAMDEATFATRPSH